MRTFLLFSTIFWNFLCATTYQFNTIPSTNYSTNTAIHATANDQEQPFAVCMDAIQIDLMAVTGTTKLTASELEAGLSRDNLTAYKNLHFSFSSDVKNTSLTFDCHNKGRNIIELWVTDEAGNQDYCTTVVNISDSNRVCGMSFKAGSLAAFIKKSE